jgi:hypothetical protein
MELLSDYVVVQLKVLVQDNTIDLYPFGSENERKMIFKISACTAKSQDQK